MNAKKHLAGPRGHLAGFAPTYTTHHIRSGDLQTGHLVFLVQEMMRFTCFVPTMYGCVCKLPNNLVLEVLRSVLRLEVCAPSHEVDVHDRPAELAKSL